MNMDYKGYSILTIAGTALLLLLLVLRKLMVISIPPIAVILYLLPVLYALFDIYLIWQAFEDDGIGSGFLILGGTLVKGGLSVVFLFVVAHSIATSLVKEADGLNADGFELLGNIFFTAIGGFYSLLILLAVVVVCLVVDMGSTALVLYFLDLDFKVVAGIIQLLSAGAALLLFMRFI